MPKDAPGFATADVLKAMREKRSAHWKKAGEEKSLALFKAASVKVPAYRDFLKKNRVARDKIRTFKDFTHLPLISKQNYLRQYPLSSLVWNGTFKGNHFVSSTSGSTGEPFYVPRSPLLEWQSSVIHEQFLRLRPETKNEPALVVVAFSMGVWVAGTLTCRALQEAGERGGFPLSIIAPGINKHETLAVLKNLAPQYKHIILAGYPPFIKDVLDEAKDAGIELGSMAIRIIFAAESFSEDFRDYMIRLGGIKDPHLDTMNIYGTVELGTMAYETPVSILIRRIALRNLQIFEGIFSSIRKTPTLAQYNPLFTNFESCDGDVIITGDSSLPLVRFDLGDNGGVATWDEMQCALSSLGVNIAKEARSAGIQRTIHELPFVHVYERRNFVTTLYGLQVYPENIREVLLHRPLSNYLTGKFTMLTKYDRTHDQYLEINLELKKDRKATSHVKKNTLPKIVAHLRTRNAEFRELSNQLKERAYPKLVFWPHEHPLHFKPGIKQKWTKSR